MLRSIFRNIARFSKQHQKPILDPTAYYNNRKQTLAKDIQKYPYNFKISRSIQQFKSLYNDTIQQVNESVAGRITRIRNHGKLSFIDIKENGYKIQAAVEKIDSRLKRGDIVGIKGVPFRTHKGQLTIKVEDIILLAPCFHMLPEQQNLKDVQIKQRKRHLDLITNKDTLNKLKIRSRAIQFIRKYLDEKGYLQVQTPCLSPSAGGAIAKPFQSYLHQMDMPLYMRIAPQLYLKQLLVGGIPKVYQLGKNFRNEGIDPTHNPQFTSLELYEMYKNHEDMMKMTEDMMRELVKYITGGYQLNIDNKIVSFKDPWRRISFVNGIEEATKCQLPKQFESQQSTHFLNKLCQDHKIQCSQPRTSARLLDKLSSHFLQNQTSPLFIYEYPTCMSPLAKTLPNNLQITQRFEGFINGWQICNSYTELNNPEEQLKNSPTDLDFVECLEYGLPPCAGLGVGIDRLIMLLTKSSTIQQVIAFPLTKPLPKIQ